MESIKTISKESILTKLVEMASIGNQEPYRIYHDENHGKSFHGADLEHANIVASNFAHAFLMARDYLLTHTADSFDICYEDFEYYPTVDQAAADLIAMFSDAGGGLWIQRASEPCQMEWSDSEDDVDEEPAAGAKRARHE